MRALLLVVVLLAGCAAPAAPGPAAPHEPTPTGGLAEPGWETPVRLGGATNGAEPQVLSTSTGALFVHTPLQLWRSLDGGATYDALGEPACDAPQGIALPECAGGELRRNPGLVGPGDGALVELADGKLLWAGLAGPDHWVPAQFSADEGETWSAPRDLSETGSDREWLAARPDGLVLAIWRVPNAAVEARVSSDNGTTWTDIVRIGEDHAIGAPVAHPSGSLLVPMYGLGRDEGLHLARSGDDGRTWEVFQATKTKTNAPVRNGVPIAAFPVAAVDDAGGLHVAWAGSAVQAQTLGVKAADVPRVQLISSADEGRTWTEPAFLSGENVAAILPWMVAGREGRIAVAWYENERGAPNEFVPDAWRVRVVLVDNGSVVASTLVTEEPVHVGQACTDGTACLVTARERALLDMLGLALAPDGRLVVAYAGNGGVPRGPVSVHAARTTGDVGLR